MAIEKKVRPVVIETRKKGRRRCSIEIRTMELRVVTGPCGKDRDGRARAEDLFAGCTRVVHDTRVLIKFRTGKDR